MINNIKKILSIKTIKSYVIMIFILFVFTQNVLFVKNDNVYILK